MLSLLGIYGKVMARSGTFMVAAIICALVGATAPAHAADKNGQKVSPKFVVMIGDSLTAGYGLPVEESIPSVLQTILRKQGHNVRVINAGVSGDTSTGGRARLDWALHDANEGKPDLVIVELGANDALRGIEPKLTHDNIDAILTTLTSRNIKVLLSGMLAPPNMGKDYAATFNDLFPTLAKKHRVAFDPFFLVGVAAQSKLNQADGMHPNAEGAAQIAERLAPIVAKLLTEK